MPAARAGESKVVAMFPFRTRRPKLAVVTDEPAAPSLAERALDHVDELYGLARHLTGSAGDAEDLVQDTYARALAGSASFIPDSNLRAWLFRILRNCFIDRARRAKIVLELPDEVDVAPPETWGATALDQLRYLTASEVGAAIAMLPVEYRLVILLDVEGFSEAEIADIARCAPGTVKSRLSRARARLRAALKESP